MVLNVQIRTFLLGTQCSEKNINLVKKPPALEKSKEFNGAIVPINTYLIGKNSPDKFTDIFRDRCFFLP